MDDDLEDEEEEAEIDDVEDIEGEDGVAAGNVNGSDDDEEEEEMSNPPMGSNHGAILNVSAVADALANNPAEAAKLLEQHQQLDKRQRQQFLMQGRHIHIYQIRRYFYHCSNFHIMMHHINSISNRNVFCYIVC